MKMTISVGRCLKSKVVKEHINKNFATCKSLCNLQELYTAFKEKHPNVNIVFSKFCVLRLKWCVLAGYNDSLCLRLQYSSKCCAASRYSGLGLDIEKPDQLNFVLPEVFTLKFICDYFYITIIHKSIFFTGTSLVQLIWKCC